MIANKAQIQSQVIVYILAVIIMAMVLVFGYKAVAGMKTQAETAQLLTFRSDLTNEIKSIGGDYGTSKVKFFSVPPKYRQVCLVNLEHSDADGANDVYAQIQALKPSAIIKDAVKSMTMTGSNYERKNVFLCPTCVDQLYVGNITLLDKDGADTVFRCFDITQGNLKLTIVGLGDRAEIS
jgi:hypothetical protein